MSIIRTYFDKNNTILANSHNVLNDTGTTVTLTGNTINTGRNPVTELYYGDGVSRYIFYIDFEALRDTISGQTINPSTITRHTLKMKNTSSYDVLPYRDYRDQIQFSLNEHAYSFDLDLYLISSGQTWDEGIGYDYDNTFTRQDENTYVLGASNWLHRTTINDWDNEGVIATGETPVITQHFDKGNEDVEMDVTNIVNDILLSGATYSGFCLKFPNDFETLATDNKTIVGFFSRHTNTFFEPFIETEYNDLVKDDRRNFILDQTNYLVLYVTEKGNLFNLDELPTCTINDNEFEVTQITKGIYSAEVLLPSSGFTDLVMYHDVWSNIIINGVTQSDITMNIVPQPNTYRYQISEKSYEPIRYGIAVSGIKRDEKLTQGERKKIIITARRPYTIYDAEVIDNIFYRLYVKQGANQIKVIDWTEVNRSFNSNYFILDTSWLVPQQYFVDMKVEHGGEVNIYNEELRFTIVSTM